jgi:hypothetical protein
MKTRLANSILNRIILISLVFSFLPRLGQGAEFVILNDVIAYPNTTDDNGFYFFYYNSSMPANWTTPNDYVNGEVWTRYEIISQATSTTLGLQFGIWQKLPPVTGTLYESMASVSLLYGPGTIATDHSSPNTWWTYNGGVDFTKMDQVWHFGINPYKMVPYQQQIRQENPDVWAERFTYWFPMTVRVTVVAVSAGSTFSGWNNYLGVKPATPSYTINYSTVKTNQVVPSTDEYSYSSSMSPAYSGTGVPVDLQPGQTIYFRTKAAGYNPASDIQTLPLPARPTISTFSVDFTNAQTNETVPSNVAYSTAADFASATNGTGVKLNLTPGQDLYLRVPPTASTFPSVTVHLIVPARPAAPSVTINYATVKTNEVLGSGVEYSTDISMSDAISCSNALLDLVPGTDMYFRVKQTGSSFASLITSLDVPALPSTPYITANFTTEFTSTVSSDIEWSADASMSSASQGQGNPIVLVPGTDMYFRVKATESSFPSAIQHLVVPSRPATPQYTINYSAEKTNEPVSTKDDYSTNSSMSNANSGNNTTITLNPGTDMYFRTRASAISFGSAIQSLDVPSRPQAPEFSINFAEGTTNEPVSTNIEYSTEADFSGAEYGTGAPLELDPGNNLFFRQKSGSGAFHSGIFELEVPRCNYLGYSGTDTIIVTYFTVYAILTDDNIEFSLDDLLITNGTATNLRDRNRFDVYPSTQGVVSLVIPANSITDNSFASNEVRVCYDGPLSVPSAEVDEDFCLYPNPSINGIINLISVNNLTYSVEVISNEGRLVKKIDSFTGEIQEIDLEELQDGIYFLKICLPDRVSIQKVFLN